MSLPTINTYDVNDIGFGLYWKASPKSDIVSWNLYGAPQVLVDFIPPEMGVVLPGLFTKILDGIHNRDNYITPGSCFIEITRASLGIKPEDPYYFLITSVDRNGVESAMEVSNIHATPYADDYFVDEAGQPANVVYKNFEFDMWPNTYWDQNRYLDIISLLGRPAKEVKIDVIGTNIWVRLNSMANDPISIRESSPYQFLHLIRGEMTINSIYFHNPTGSDATVRVFVAA